MGTTRGNTILKANLKIILENTLNKEKSTVPL